MTELSDTDRFIRVFDKIRIDRKAVTMFYGDGKTGKTTTIYYAMTKVKGKQLFIDTEGAFDIDRFEAIVGVSLEEEEINEATTLYFNEDYEITVRDASTWIEVKTLLKKKSKEEYDFVAVDSIGVLYRDELIDPIKAKQYQKRMLLAKDIGNMFQNLKLMIAKRKGFAIITNWKTSALETEESKYPFLMGKTADQRPKNIYEFNHVDRDLKDLKVKGVREIVVYKAKNLPDGLSVQFEFNDKGMKMI